MSAPPLHLDFVAPPVYRWRRWCWAALALMVVCVVVLGQLQSVVSERLEATQARHDLLRERLHAAGPRPGPPADAQTTGDIHAPTPGLAAPRGPRGRRPPGPRASPPTSSAPATQPGRPAPRHRRLRFQRWRFMARAATQPPG